MDIAVSGITRSRQLRALLMFFAMACLVYLLSAWILNGSVLYLELGGMAIGMVAITFLILKDWRIGFFLFILWLLFEDLARKYLGNGTLFFFGKDVLAAMIYLALIGAKRRGEVKLFRAPFFLPLAMFFGLALIQIVNPESPSVLYGFLGMKLYFYYVPLMFVGYAMLRTGKDLDRFLIISVVIGIAIALLGIVQSVVGLTFLNPTALAPELRELGTLTRYSPITHKAVLAPTSVFVSAGRFVAYMILLIILSLGTQAYVLLTRRKGAFYGFLGIGIALVGAMQSASRTTIVFAVTSILVISTGVFWGASWQGNQGHHLRKAVGRSVFVGAFGLLLMIQLFPKSIGASWAFYSETLDPTSSTSELQIRTVDYPLENLRKSFTNPDWLTGNGTGTASLGIQYITRLLGKEATNTAGVENGYGQILLEMGILGPILWLAWTLMYIAYAWKIVRSLRGTVYFPIGFAILWYSFLLLFPYTYSGLDAYQNFVMNAYFWILAGVLARLPELARVPQVAPVRSKVPGLVDVPSLVGAR